jgi:hypothetical protein
MAGLTKERRDKLKKLLPRLRKNIEGAYEVKLKAVGLLTQCSRNHSHAIECYIRAFENLCLKEREKSLRESVITAIEREKKGFETTKEPEKTQKAIGRYIQACAYTLINRLSALKVMELRGLFEESVTRRDKYEGLSLKEYKIRKKNPGIAPDRLLQQALKQGFSDVAEEIALLFDTEDPYAYLFPDPAELRKIIEILNEEITESDWLTDDILGWVYQFWNEEARREYRTGRGRGSRRLPEPDDIPVINQLYTPHWVVKVLTDNTLGRLWLEMKRRCPEEENITKHPKLIYKEPKSKTVDEFCSYLVPLPSKPQKVEYKHPREIKVLDPACGSGHFLIYAFEVLWRIWREEKLSLEPEQIAANILKFNLYGIDIDLRATQLATLGLYLKAKELIKKELKKRELFEREILKRVKRFRPEKMNIVSADTRLLDGNRKRAFLRYFEDEPDVYEISKRLFDDLDYTYEYGSLLKVRTPFEKLFKARKKSAMEIRERAEQLYLFPERTQLDLGDIRITVPKEITLEDIGDIIDLFEKRALERHSVGDILFSIDAGRSVGLLSLLMQKYDVILMNPPYGDVSQKAKKYLNEYYPKTHNDVYSAFIDQVIDLLEDGGYVGMLTNLTFMYLSSHRWLRENILKDVASPRLLLEFGLGILDGAAVYTAGTVLKKGERETNEETVFIRLTEPPTEEKQKVFAEILRSILKGEKHSEVFKASLEDLGKVPGMPYAYWASPTLRALFTKYPPLDRDMAKRPDQPKIADVKVGLQTGDDTRFTRRWWEIAPSLFASSREETFQGKKWVPFAKGEEYARYYADISLVVNWEQDGEEIKNFVDAHGKVLSRPQNESFYFREGLTWQFSNVLIYSRFRMLPRGTIFSVASHGCFPLCDSLEEKFGLLGTLNSSLTNFLILILKSDDRNWHIGYIAPMPVLSTSDKKVRLSDLSRHTHDLLREWDTGNETSTVFTKPWLVQVAFGQNFGEKPETGHPFAKHFEWTDWDILKGIREIQGNIEMPLEDLAKLVLQRENKLIDYLTKLQKEIDETAYELYEISSEDRKLIERELKRMQGEAVGEEIPPEIRRLFPPLKSPASVKEEIRIQEHVKRLISWYAKRVILEDRDGIVPLNGTFEDNLYDQVVGLMEKEWGEERTQRLLDEIYKILSKTLGDWLFGDYFPYHCSLYKNRPIFWLLGPFRTGGKGNPPFACFLNFHKLTSDTIPKVRMFYLSKVMQENKVQLDVKMREYSFMNDEEKRGRRGKRIAQAIDKLRGNLNHLEDLNKRLEELTRPASYLKAPKENDSWLEKKIYEVRENRYQPILDYGVLVNITPLKKAGVLHKSSERVR